MKVKLNILERVLIKLVWLLNNLSFTIGQSIHKKYDPEYIYNTHTYNGKDCKEMIFSNKEES